MPTTGAGRIREHVAEAAARLSGAGVETARVDAEWLLADLLGVGRTALWLRGAEALAPEIVERYQARLARRAAREPLQQIVGWADFRGLRIGVTPAVLVPRPETELLVEYALGALPARSRRRPLAVDLGTGSGCVACGLAYARPDLEVIAVDISEAAARVARDNVRALGLAGRVRVVVGDLLEPLRRRRVDLVVANPPYLTAGLVDTLTPEIRDHEPRLALDGGPDGLAVIRRLVPAAGATLRPGGWLWLEVAGREQAAVTQGLLAGTPGFRTLEVTRPDLAGRDRFIGAERAGRRAARARGGRLALRRA